MRPSNTSSTMSSYIMGSHIASMVVSVRVTKMPHPPGSRIHVNIVQPRRYTAPPQSLKLSVVLLLLFFFCGVGFKLPLGPFFRSPRFRFLRSLCSSPLGPYKSQHCGHIGLLCIPRMIHEGNCGVIGGANDDCRGSRRTRR
jgi:hypothetical protein